jgi:hypothetical protein
MLVLALMPLPIHSKIMLVLALIQTAADKSLYMTSQASAVFWDSKVLGLPTVLAVQ